MAEVPGQAIEQTRGFTVVISFTQLKIFNNTSSSMKISENEIRRKTNKQVEEAIGGEKVVRFRKAQKIKLLGHV